MTNISEMNQDLWFGLNYGLPSGLFYYLLNENIEGYSQNDEMILGNCSAIQSVQYVPFLEIEEVNLYKIPYDVSRFGAIDKSRPNLPTTPNVYRLAMSRANPRLLGEFKCYKPDKNIGGLMNWKNESRLYNYPYMFAMLTDHLNPPMEIKYHLCENGNNAKIFVKNSISDRCSYGLFIENYKGDVDGKLESMVSGDAHELPCSSSAYSQWFASNKNQSNQNIKNVIDNSFLTRESASRMMIPNIIGSIASTSSSLTGLIGSGANIYGQVIENQQLNKRTGLDIQQAIQGKIAQTKDLKSTPNTMISMGSDVYYGLANGDKKLTLYRFGLEEEQYEKLGYYFAMFGYKQNKIMTINLRNRYFYNYIKTVNININGHKIPRNHLDDLKEIFNSGVTIWHYDREGVTVGDYRYDNYEVE